MIPIIEDARHPHKYRMLVQMVDCMFADVAQPDQVRCAEQRVHSLLRDTATATMLLSAASVTLPNAHCNHAVVTVGLIAYLSRLLFAWSSRRNTMLVQNVHRPPAPRWKFARPDSDRR